MDIILQISIIMSAVLLTVSIAVQSPKGELAKAKSNLNSQFSQRKSNTFVTKSTWVFSSILSLLIILSHCI